MMFVIQVSICEPISIGYTQKSLIQYGKNGLWYSMEKIAEFFEEFSKNSAKNQGFLREFALDNHFTLNAFNISWK